MKVAVIKIGARIAWGNKDTSGGSGEAKSIINMLRLGGCDIDIYTKVLSKDKNPDYYTFYNIEDEYQNINSRGYEGLIVLNGNVNFFGGAETPDTILTYWLINNFKGRVFYIYCDPSLLLTPLWPAIERKPWSTNWKKEDIDVTRKDIIYISQPYELNDIKQLTDKTGIIPEKIIHYPFEQFPCLNPILNPKENPSVDLSYGGTMRGNRRVKKMAKFYFNYSEQIGVEMFGKIDVDVIQKAADKIYKVGCRAPKIGPPVNYADFNEKMNDTLTHVVIGDPFYEGRDMPQRCYESIWSNVVTFIDIELDPLKRVFGNDQICTAFNYVKSQEDVEKRITFLKNNPDKRKEVLEHQIKAVSFDSNLYCNNFVKILKENSMGPVKTGNPVTRVKPNEDNFDEVESSTSSIKITGPLF